MRHRYGNLQRSGVKTTLDIDDQWLVNARAFAAQQPTILTRLIEEGFQVRLRAHEAPHRAEARLPVFKGRGGLVMCWRASCVC